VPTLGQARQAIESLDRDLRRGQVDPELLDELGWDLSTAQRFVEAYRRSAVQLQVQPLPDDGRAPSRPQGRPQPIARPSRPERVLRAGGAVAPDARGLYEADTRPADDTRDLMQAGQQRVPARYDPILKAYYRTLASQPAG